MFVFFYLFLSLYFYFTFVFFDGVFALKGFLFFFLFLLCLSFPNSQTEISCASVQNS